ncbi:MAG TPA: 4'-phosphopantetheinyl transferase superfamily protein [Verrucomicrobiota bacterium]|nr:4'-phosphopantetheinyl transferase superfamily protein [Verrucomicrobiota bacterium]
MATRKLLWNPGTPEAAPAADVVHVWCIDLDLPQARVDGLFQTLSPDERDRAGRFKFASGRNHYIVGRAMLRRLLGGALSLDPAALKFSYGPHGKPELAGTAAGLLRFNLSHSSGLALIAVTSGCPVGVDIEHTRPAKLASEIAARFFTQRESNALGQLSEASRAEAFLRLWTRKEAWLKATGGALVESIRRVEISVHPGEPARVLEVEGRPGEAAAWTLTDLQPADGFIGALAVRAGDLNVSCRAWVE